MDKMKATGITCFRSFSKMAGLRGKLVWSIVALLLALAVGCWLGASGATGILNASHQDEVQALKSAYDAEKQALIDELSLAQGKLAGAYNEMFSMRAELETWREGGATAWLDEDGVRIDRMSGFYRNRDPWGISLAETDAEFREYCQVNFPYAVYPSDEWTAEEVIQSYRETPEIWGFWTDSYSQDGFYFTWTPGYQHCLILSSGYLPEEWAYGELDSGWLIVDGVRVEAYGPTLDTVEPRSLAALYRSGAWDGSPVRSADWGTEVFVDSEGVLDYFYFAYSYDETYDPEGLAYTGYAEPWWAGQIDPEIAVLMEEEAQYYAPEKTGGVLAFGSAKVRMPVV